MQGDLREGQVVKLPSYAFKEDEEQKRFIPDETPYLNIKLVESLKYRKKNFFLLCVLENHKSLPFQE